MSAFNLWLTKIALQHCQLAVNHFVMIWKHFWESLPNRYSVL